jgi:hypothetical protein
MPLFSPVLLSTAYLPPVQYYKELLTYEQIIIEHFEHFPKQTYRNRSCIYSPNGKQMLGVPLEGRKERTITKDIRICYTDPWQKIHWRSLESAYRRSAYFEYYEDDFFPFYNKRKYEFLIDLNFHLLETINSLLKIKINCACTTQYEKIPDGITDLRNILSTKDIFNTGQAIQLNEYTQVFDNKHGFVPNLSIIDLLFNQGPRSLDFLTFR